MSNRINLGQVIGATGQAGQDGAKGDKGDAGDTPYIQNGYWWIGTTNTGVVAKGNEWFYGDAVPTSQGVNGDLYLRSNGDVYKKESGVWVLKTSIKGAQGEQGERGETALTFDIGSVTTGDTPSVTNSGTEEDIVLDFVLPKGEKGDKGDRGDSTITVGGFVVSNVSFDSDPQGQIDGKLDNNFGSQNAGKWLQIDSNGQAVPTSSSAEDDVIDGYYYNDSFYSDAQHTELITGAEGKIYIDVVTNSQYRWNGTEYAGLTADLSGYATKTQAVGSIELTMNSSTYVLTVQAKNVNGENIGTAQQVDLPLESVVVNGSYDSQTKKLILTLQNGNTVPIDISDIISGLQAEITAQNKLSADLVDDTSSTNKFTNATEKATWNAKADASALANYLPLAGGTMTGGLRVENNNGVYIENGSLQVESNTAQSPTRVGIVVLKSNGAGSIMSIANRDTTGWGHLGITEIRGNTINNQSVAQKSPMLWLITNAQNCCILGKYQTELGGSYNGVDLGNSTEQWKDLYLSGNVSDGTNAVSVAEIAKKSIIADYTLTANGWSNNSQTISITGKTASNNARVSNSNTGTDQQVLANSQAIASANIYKITDNGTSLTFVCETTPTSDIVIQVEVFE